MTPPARSRILVVDDNDAGRYAVGRVLRHAGFEVTEAETGAEALRRVGRDRPDLVLLDVRLPDMTGVDVCRRIKSTTETSTTAVLQMSASAVDDHSRVAALEGGADGYITSPVEPAVLVATVRSLLRIRAAEQALHEAALEWQATFDAIHDGVASLDVQGVVRRSNAALPGLLGRDPKEVSGKPLDELIPPAAGDPTVAEMIAGLGHTTTERELGERCFRLTIDPMGGSAEKLRGGVAIVTDITERKLLDEQLRHSQKLESIGLLAGGVAHDFNNILMGILGNASLAMDSLQDAGRTRELLGDVVRASERAAELTRQLLAYAGKGRFLTEPLDLSTSIHELVPLIQSSIPRKVRLMLDLRDDVPMIQADRTQVEQLAMNLIINAGEAIEGDSGSVVVSTATRAIGTEELSTFLTEQHEAGQYVVLQVIDTGSGMDEETVKRIFDPFFSTKFLGRGLGLSAVLGIIRGHKGAVKVTSSPGHGTIFEVLFPACEGVGKPARPPEETRIVQGHGTVLVVDDEEIVRNMLQQSLKRAGYEVILAENGAEALEVLSRNVNRIGLVVLDVVMPVMSGEEALPLLLTINPNLPVIVSSGQDEEECMKKLGEPRIAGFLPKPYTPASLSAMVHSVLQSRAGAAGSETA